MKTIAIAPTTKRVAYHRPSRSPNRGRRSFSPAEDIPDASHRMEQLLLEGSIDLFTQPADEDVHDVGLRIEAVFPDVRQNHRLRHDAAGVAHEVFEKGELAGPQIEDDVVPRDAPRQQVEDDILNR